MSAHLFVFLYGCGTGTLKRRTESGVEFRYDHDARLDTSLSLSMASAPRKLYSADKASPFFNGLIPVPAERTGGTLRATPLLLATRS